jgi:hypothetical protein
MDREGHTYHLACWLKMMDDPIQETPKLLADPLSPPDRSTTSVKPWS